MEATSRNSVYRPTQSHHTLVCPPPPPPPPQLLLFRFRFRSFRVPYFLLHFRTHRQSGGAVPARVEQQRPSADPGLHRRVAALLLLRSQVVHAAPPAETILLLDRPLHRQLALSRPRGFEFLVVIVLVDLRRTANAQECEECEEC